MQFTKRRFAASVAALIGSAVALAAILAVLFDFGEVQFAGTIAVIGTLYCIGSFFALGGSSHGFSMRYGDANMYGQSLRYPGADALTKEDYTRMADQQRKDLRRGAPLAALLGAAGVLTFIAAIVFAQVTK